MLPAGLHARPLHPRDGATKPSYNALRRLHCVKFDPVPSSIFERIPHWFNHVISYG